MSSGLPRVLSPRELSEETGIPRSTWYTAIANGDVPVYRLGSSVWVALEDAKKFLESRREVAK